jgi:broad specificity phosphatase PhoE
MLDPPLTEIGRQQALRLRGVALQTAPQLVLVSPMSSWDTVLESSVGVTR